MNFTRFVQQGGDNSAFFFSGAAPLDLLLQSPLGFMNFLPLSFGDPAEFLMGGGNPPRPPTAQSVVNSLPIHKLGQKEEDCPICQSEMQIGEEAMSLPCNHKFHPDCVKPWLRENNTCPTCRYELDTDDQQYNNEIRQRRGQAMSGGAARTSTERNSSNEQRQNQSLSGAGVRNQASVERPATAPQPSNEQRRIRVVVNVPRGRNQPRTLLEQSIQRTVSHENVNPRRLPPLNSESEEILGAAMREFEEMELRSRTPGQTMLNNQADDQTTAAHLQALNCHSQMIQLHSELTRRNPSLSAEERERLHAQAMQAHAALMSAHNSFINRNQRKRRPSGREEDSERKARNMSQA